LYPRSFICIRRRKKIPKALPQQCEIFWPSNRSVYINIISCIGIRGAIEERSISVPEENPDKNKKYNEIEVKSLNYYYYYYYRILQISRLRADRKSLLLSYNNNNNIIIIIILCALLLSLYYIIYQPRPSEIVTGQRRVLFAGQIHSTRFVSYCIIGRMEKKKENEIIA